MRFCCAGRAVGEHAVTSANVTGSVVSADRATTTSVCGSDGQRFVKLIVAVVLRDLFDPFIYCNKRITSTLAERRVCSGLWVSVIWLFG